MFPAFSTSDVNSPAITSVTTEFTFGQQLISDLFFLVFASNDMFTSHQWHSSLVFHHWYIFTAFWRFFCVFHWWLCMFPPLPRTCDMFSRVLYFLILFTPRLLFGLRDLFGLYLAAMDKVQCSFLTRCFLANFSAYFIKCCEFLIGKQNRVGF